MATTNEIEAGRLLDLTREVVGIDHGDRRARIVEQQPGRPPQRIHGLSIGASMVSGDSPHDGEVHPDGDELLYLLSGAVTVRLELPDGDRDVELGAGEAIVIPLGVWHRISLREPGQLIHITPGPGGDARPRPEGAR